MKPFAVITLAFLLGGCAAPQTVRPTVGSAAVEREAFEQQQLVVADYAENERKLHSISFPVMEAGVPFCGEEVSFAGGFIALSRLGLKPEMQKFAAAVGVTSYTQYQIVHIAPGSPFDKSRVEKGDIVLAIDGEELDPGLENFEEIWRQNSQDGIVALDIQRGGDSFTETVRLVKTCSHPVLYNEAADINAYTDGEKIYMNKGLMRVFNDDEIAVVVAHELAHIVEDHVEAKKANAMGGLLLGALVDGLAASQGIYGTDFGGAGQRAGASAYSQDFEAEADYVAVYILARAGISLDNVAKLWRKMAVEAGGNITPNAMSTHPSSAERFTAIEKYVAEVEEKIKNGEPLLPNYK